MAACNKNQENQDLVRLCGGLEMLIRLLSSEVTHLENQSDKRQLDATRIVGLAPATVCAYVAGCLASVAEGNSQNQEALDQAGGIQLLLRTLETCLQSPHVVTNASVAVAHLAHRHEASQHAARAHGGVQVVLSALLAYRDHAAVQGGLCRAVAVLTENSQANQQAFLRAALPDGRQSEAGVITLLLEALSEAQEDEPLTTTACWALANLVAADPAAMEQVRQSGGLHTVTARLRHFAQEERACEYICRLLAELARGGSRAACRNRHELRTLGACEVVTAVAQRHAQSQGFVLVRAREALQNLEDPSSLDGREH
jgi:hypothetical protein